MGIQCMLWHENFFLIMSAELQFCTYSKVLSLSGRRCLVRPVCVQSSFQSWYTFLVSVFGVFYLRGFPIVPASIHASLPIHLHCPFPIISLNQPHLLLLSIRDHFPLSLAIKGAKEVSLPCTSHFLFWSFSAVKYSMFDSITLKFLRCWT